MHPFETPGMLCIFHIMRVKIKGKNSGFANVLWDCCASKCLITNAKVKEMGIKGTPSKITLTVVGGIEQCLESKCYKLPMLDLQGRTFMVEAHSIDKISDNIRSLDYEKIKKYLSLISR